MRKLGKSLRKTQKKKSQGASNKSYVKPPVRFVCHVQICQNYLEKLEVKLRVDNARNKKYVTNEWMHFQITNDKPITEQVHVYENLYAEVLNKNMKMCEILQANVLI